MELTLDQGRPRCRVGGQLSSRDRVVMVEIVGAGEAFVMAAIVVERRPNREIMSIVDLVSFLHVVPCAVDSLFLNLGKNGIGALLNNIRRRVSLFGLIN